MEQVLSYSHLIYYHSFADAPRWPFSIHQDYIDVLNEQLHMCVKCGIRYLKASLRTLVDK